MLNVILVLLCFIIFLLLLLRYLSWEVHSDLKFHGTFYRLSSGKYIDVGREIKDDVFMGKSAYQNYNSTINNQIQNDGLQTLVMTSNDLPLEIKGMQQIEKVDEFGIMLPRRRDIR